MSQEEKEFRNLIMTAVIIVFMLIYSNYQIILMDKLIIENAQTALRLEDTFTKLRNGYVYQCNVEKLKMAGMEDQADDLMGIKTDGVFANLR